MKITKLLRKMLPLKPCGAVIVAAGTASRMGGIDKILAPLDGEPVICHSLEAFQESDVIWEIVVVTREELVAPIGELCKKYPKVKAVIPGGETRQDSVALGLEALSKDMDLAAVHDGARPLISLEVIDRAVRAANSYSAAAPAVPVKDTVKMVEGGLAVSTPDRSKLRAVQTPQVFGRELLRAALYKVQKEKTSVTDDCAAVERLGVKVKMVEGDERNIKITTPMDLVVARMLMEEEK